MGFFSSKEPDIVNLKTEKDINGLIKALGHRNVWVRREAAIALGESGDMRAIEPLVMSLGDFSINHTAIESLVKIGLPAVIPLTEALGGNDELTMMGAIKALSMIGDWRAVEPLVSLLLFLLDDRVKNIRAITEVIDALVLLNDERVIEPLINLLDDDGPGDHAEQALIKIGEPAIIPLIFAFHRESVIAWSHMYRIFASIGQPAVLPLLEAIACDDINIRIGAATSLGYIGDISALEPLLRRYEQIKMDTFDDFLETSAIVKAVENIRLQSKIN